MSSDTAPWWERFFGGDNYLRWPALRNQESPWTPHVSPWLEIARGTDFDLPLVLPRLDANGQPAWYCGGRNARGALRLREALQAFVGPSYSDFDGRSHSLDWDDPVEAAFAEGTVEPVFLIRPSRGSDERKIQRALALYVGLLARMPKQETHTPSPLGALRSELDRAIAAGDEREARRLLRRIRRVGRLDAENLLYLEVGVRAGLGQWREIAEDDALLTQLTGLRLPPRVLADIHEALYRLHVEPQEDARAPQLALQAFRAARLEHRSALFGTRRGLRSPRIIKAFFLYELTREGADHALLANLASELGQLDDPFAQALISLQPRTDTQVPTDPLRLAADAFTSLESDRALELALQAPPSRERLTLLIRCAEDIGTKEAAERVLSAVSPGDDAENLKDSFPNRLRALERMRRDRLDGQTPHGLLEWARWVNSGAGEDDAMSALRERLPTWDCEAIARSTQKINELASIINNASGPADSLFREATPLLYQAVVPESGHPPRQTKPLLQILITKVALLPGPSADELALARDMAATLLQSGLDQNDYASLVSDLEDLMGTQLSVHTISWALDLAELLAIHACPNPEQRLRFVLSVIDHAQRMAHRLLPIDSMVVEQLCKDVDIELPVEFVRDDDHDVSSAERNLSGKKVGIYTLTEPAGQRAAALLEKLCPTVQVELNSDHECTPRLINLARSADLFVFAWKSSKHQAFYCVKGHRETDRPLIQPQGKGTSSIVRALLEAV